MKSLPLAFSQNLLLTAIHLEQLYTFEFPSGTYRWCSGNHSIYYSGYWWESKQINFTNASSNLTGQADKLSIEIQNVDKRFSNIVLAQDIRGKQVIIYRVLLDKNYQVIGAPALFFIGYIDQMNIDRQSAKIDVYNHFVKWQTKTPKRQHGPLCSWLFGGLECGFNGNVIVNPNSDIAVAFTRHGSSVADYLNVDDYMADLCFGGTAPTVVQGSDSNYYTCILSHLSAAANKPVTGASWTTYWRLTSDFTGAAWASGQNYVTGVQSLTNATGYDPTKAFDGNLSTYFQSGNPGAGWIQYAFASSKVITKYTIYPGAVNYRPTTWHFQGSNDGATWIDLDVVSGKSWDTNESFGSFDISNTTAYSFYRLYWTTTDSTNAVIIYALQMSGDGTQFNDADYNSFSGTGAGADIFGFPMIVLAPDVTQIAVTVHLRAKQITASARNVSGRIRVFGTDYDATGILPATSFTGYDFVWLLNPATGVAWKYSEASSPSDDLTLANAAGTASADGDDGTHHPLNAFDNNASTWWSSAATALPHWLQFKFNVGVKALGYTILGYSTPGYMPTAWTLKGSNDGSSWTTLDTRSGISWTANQKQYFLIATPGTYTYYQLYMTAGGVSGEVTVVEMEYFSSLFLQAIGYSTPADAGGHEVDVSQCYLKNYSYANWCDLTPGRCYALNNRINFGGFYYIPELAQKEFWWGVVQKIFTGSYGT